MSRPFLDQSIFATDPLSEAQAVDTAGAGPKDGLSMRWVVAVSVVGAGIWYVLWKIALHMVAGK
jgi:uncharacterized ion transporter superfamily protein YfcC